MTSRLLKMSVVALAFLVTTSPAWASSSNNCSRCLKVYLEGVDKCGCLTVCGGECAKFYACVNCCTGKFYGKACGSVHNCSCRCQTYRCKNFFCDTCWRVCVDASCYTVAKCGSCTYIACGTVYSL